jgi:hypothetical protein
MQAADAIPISERIAPNLEMLFVGKTTLAAMTIAAEM